MDGLISTNTVEVIGYMGAAAFFVLGLLTFAIPKKDLGRKMRWLAMVNVALGIFFPVAEFWLLMARLCAGKRALV
jgi:hypothetical protein